LELLDKALKISPDNYWLLDNKGVVLYKQGKYKEALDFLQKSWDLRMKNSFYNHDAFLELEAAKKAVAEQK
jgi:tetratricopeptide (TPR) repeat protein